MHVYNCRVVGEYPAQQFFTVESDGSVVLLTSLRNDAQRNTQYRVCSTNIYLHISILLHDSPDVRNCLLLFLSSNRRQFPIVSLEIRQ